MKRIIATFAFACFVYPASAQHVVRELLPAPPKGDKLEARLATAMIEPGAVGKWHTYPTHPIVYVAEGTLTVEFRDRKSKTYRAGEGFVEPVNEVLRGANKGKTPVKLVIFQVSPPDIPESVDAP